MNFLMTTVGMMLVDRKGAGFLFILGTSGIIVSLIGVGTLFLRTEKSQRRYTPDCSANGRNRPAAHHAL